MCGIVGIVGKYPVNQALYDGLTVLQHRGQDAAGIVTVDHNTLRLRKANGLVKDVFEARHMQRLAGNIGIGHVRYPTAGSSSTAEAQPFYVNSPFGIALAHNGNLTNSHILKEDIFRVARRHVNTTSDSEVLLNVLAHELHNSGVMELQAEHIFRAVANVHRKVKGGYAVVALIIGHGLLAFRDPNGIRPLVMGKRETDLGTEYMVASESVALDADGFTVLRDVSPGEAVYITEQGELHSFQCAENPSYTPCIFEYVYFARPDSTIDNISVYASRVAMGTMLGQKIKREWAHLDIDVVIPIPETSNDAALQIATELGLPYRQGYVKNRYIGRTFIMPGQEARKKSVKRKLNAIKQEFIIDLSDRRGLFYQAMEHKLPLWVDDPSSKKWQEQCKELQARHVSRQGFLLAPLLVDSKVIGFYYADRGPSERAFEDVDFQSFIHFSQLANVCFTVSSR